MADRFSMLFAARGAEIREMAARLKRLAAQRDALRASVKRLADEERRFLEDHGTSIDERQTALAASAERQKQLRKGIDDARKQLETYRNKTRNTFAILSAKLAYFMDEQSVSVPEMREQIVELAQNVDEWESELGKLTVERAEQKNQLATLEAPLDSIRYALTHFRTTLEDLKRRRKALTKQIVRLLKEHVQFTPLSIWRQRCADGKNGEALFARVLSLRKKLRLAACLGALHRREMAPAEVSLEVPHYIAAVRKDLQTTKYPVMGRIPMSGDGYYHRKVRTSKGSKWRRRDITFDDVLKFEFHIQARSWEPQTVSAAIRDGAKDALERGYQSENQARLFRCWRACRKAIRKKTLGLLAFAAPDVFKSTGLQSESD